MLTWLKNVPQRWGPKRMPDCILMANSALSTDVPAEADIADHAGLHLFILKVDVFL